MSESEHETKPFRVEVEIDAERNAVWEALTDPAEIHRWFGWDDDGLEEEIRFIFDEDAEIDAPGRMVVASGTQTIELEARGRRTVIRVVRAGDLDAARWDGIFDGEEEGWRAFFHQLKYYLERRRGEARRTLFLAGDVSGPRLLAAMDEQAPGALWYAGRHQRGTLVEGGRPDLVIVQTRSPLTAETASRANVLVTTFGLDGPEQERLRREWTAWWGALAANVKVLPRVEAPQ